MDFWIQNASIRETEGLFEIGIEAGKIARIKPSGQSTIGDTKCIDAGGKLVTESFTNPHLHLCKVWTLDMQSEDALADYHAETMGKAMTAIESASKVKEKYAQSWIEENAEAAIKLAICYGNLHIRAFADVDTKAKLEGVKALLNLRDKYKDIVTIEVVAFPQDGVLRDDGAEALIEEAARLGVDVIGGIPWIEYTDADALSHVVKMVDIAERYGKKVSMLVDDAGDATLKTLEMLCSETIKRKMQGRVLAQHARAMLLYPMPYFQKLSHLLKEAQIGIVSDPQTGPLHARVQELLAEGNVVCLGQDDISDAYYPFGRNNMMEVAFLASHLLWMTTKTKIERLYDMITTLGARALHLENFGLKVGCDANLVIHHHDTILDVLRYHEAPRYVIAKGKVVAESQMHTKLGL